MARTEEQLRAWYGEHPDGVRRCDSPECIQCEVRDLLAEIDRLRGLLGLAVRTIEGLADQQATADDWYKEPLAQLVAQPNGGNDGR